MVATDGLIQAAADLIGERSRTALLQRVVTLARDVVPRAEHVSVTLVDDDEKLITAAGSGPLAAQLDAIQYEVGAGPCVAATRTGNLVIVPDLAAETRWPGFTTRSRSLVRSMLALPLRGGPEIQGSINLASGDSNAFSGRGRETARVFTALAALALVAAVERERAARRREQLEALADSVDSELRSALTTAFAAAEVVRRRSEQLDPRGQEALHLLMNELARQRRLLLALLPLDDPR